VPVSRVSPEFVEIMRDVFTTAPEIQTDAARQVLLCALDQVVAHNKPVLLVFGDNQSGTLGDQVSSAAHDLNSGGYTTRLGELLRENGILGSLHGFCSGREVNDAPAGHGIFLSPRRERNVYFPVDISETHVIGPTLTTEQALKIFVLPRPLESGNVPKLSPPIRPLEALGQHLKL